MPIAEYIELSPEARVELNNLHAQVEEITSKENVTREERKRVDAMLSRIATIRKTGATTQRMLQKRANDLASVLGLPQTDFSNPKAAEHEVAFRSYMNGGPEYRATDFVAGAESITYSAGEAGGVLVPTKFYDAVVAGLAAVDPLLNDNICTVIQEPDFTLRPLQIPGWDLSTIEAAQVDENDQDGASVVPGTTQKLLNSFTYRVSLGGSLEWETDTFDAAMNRMGQAFGIGFARGIGKALVNGDGAAAPAGITHGLPSAFTTANAGKIVLGDITNAYFAINPIFRASKKCGWLMNDAAYKLVSNAVDDAGRPLISVVDGSETLKGKPIHVTPSLPTTGAGSFCVFGDLSAYHIHASAMTIRRKLQVPGYVEYGKALYVGLMRVDAQLVDPTAGAMPPVIAATLHG